MPQPSAAPTARPRSRIAGIGLLLVGVLLAVQVKQLLNDPSILPPDDFIEYWAAGYLNAHGLNPYDPEKLLRLQLAAGRDTDEAVMMWNPPWTLSVAMPFGLLPSRPSQLLWLALGLALVGLCAVWAWNVYGGPAKLRWLPAALAFTFLPTFFVLQSGQIGPLLLLGAVAFVALERSGRPFAAGAAAVLLAIKPHLAYLFWIALPVWALARWGRGWKVIVGGLLTGVAATAVPLACNPDVLRQYWEALAHRPPAQWVSPTLGSVLRLWFGETSFGLQFVPMLAGLVWLAYHGWKHRRAWDWGEQMPLLLLVSFVTAPYGAWPFDLVMLLLPVVHAAARLAQAPENAVAFGRPMSRRELVLFAVLAYVAIDLLALAMNVARLHSFWFIWMAPALLAAYGLAAWATGAKHAIEPESPELALSPSVSGRSPEASGVSQ